MVRSSFVLPNPPLIGVPRLSDPRATNAQLLALADRKCDRSRVHRDRAAGTRRAHRSLPGREPAVDRSSLGSAGVGNSLLLHACGRGTIRRVGDRHLAEAGRRRPVSERDEFVIDIPMELTSSGVCEQ